MIRRRGQHNEEEASSSEDEDVFATLSRKGKKRQKFGSSNKTHSIKQPEAETLKTEIPKIKLPTPITSSMKRHHNSNDNRRAKMDALLQELEAEKTKVSKETKSRGFVPEKKGSFVDASEEHITTNIFVGNLAPSITEEDLMGLFVQFGELYSIKIMWPRTPAERERKRNTGFVCFMHRRDAEEAMHCCSEKDPFNVGRLLMMRWGKNVKKNGRNESGSQINVTGRGISAYDSREANFSKDPNEIYLESNRSRKHAEFDGPQHRSDLSTACNPIRHSADTIIVRTPPDHKRCSLISIVASYVAKDGSQLEQRLIESEGNNPEFSFLQYKPSSEDAMDEHIFYRWRVYSFCQGDTMSAWRTAPFVMFHPHGRFWIPPSIDDQVLAKAQHEKRHIGGLMTGRQIEVARRNGRNDSFDSRMKLSKEDVNTFHILVRRKLTISRESICAAMAFCFEKSVAAREIAALLKDCLIDDSQHVTVDMRIARLYLLSDILFNSQQPGIKNAFIYRDAVEKMAPQIFTSLGRHGANQIGRLRMNKLRNAVSAVLGAWTEWSVYNPAFLDELDCRFLGKEVKNDRELDRDTSDVEKQGEMTEDTEEKPEVIIQQARGDWQKISTQVNSEDENNDTGDAEKREPCKVTLQLFAKPDGLGKGDEDRKISTNKVHTEHINNIGTVCETDTAIEIDGDELSSDSGEEIDGAPLEIDNENEDVDGACLDDDDDLDGESLHDSNNLGKMDD